jgi:hypothetical protein
MLMMQTRYSIATVFALMCGTAAFAQDSAARVSGIVRDSANQPMANVDVVALPGSRRARTDSMGRFEITLPEPGRYQVRARRLGYVPAEWSVDLSKSGHAEIQLVLTKRIAPLDTVYVKAPGPCPRDSYEGFLCRRATAKAGIATFIDYTDIDAQDVDYSADLLRGVPGFGVDVASSRNGATRIPATRNCTIVLLNGVQSSWSEIPESPSMISAIEVYQSPKDIPREFSRYTWGKEHCWLVAYWTYDFTFRTLRKVRLPAA